MTTKSTITDVAKRAGVSIKTVSRVLNGEPNVRAKTRETVIAAAKALKYAPNPAARGLASSKSYLLALLYDIPSPGYIARIQKGATEACRKAGYHLVVQPMDMNDINVVQDVDSLLRRLPVDGVILTPPLCDAGEVITVLNRLAIPYVPISPSAAHGDIPIIRMDDVKAAREMTEHLIELGHVDIGFIKGHPRHNASALRFEGFREAMRRADLRINPDWIMDGDFTYRSGVAAAEILLTQNQRPTAIFASNDDMAAGVLSVANKLKISVPDQLSLAGFDDNAIADIIWPRLTTVCQPVSNMGFKAAELLLDPKLRSQGPFIHNLDHSLIKRESTKAR